MWKWRILPLAFTLFYWVTKRANLTRIYEIFITLTLIKTGWKKRHVDICGSYEHDILRNWWIWQGFIKGLAKKLNETTKEAFWQLAIFTKMANWVARIHQRLCKTSNEVTKREILTNGDHKKMENLGRKREISAKMASMPKIHQAFGKKWQKVACWLLAIFAKMTNLAKIATLARSNEWLAKWLGKKWSVGN